MKTRFAAALLGAACAFSFVTAQDVTPSVDAGSKAMLFTFNGLSFLGADNFAGGVGGKYYLTSAIALRAGLRFVMANENLPLPQGASGTDGSISATGFGISAAGEYHLLLNRVSPYVGAGVGFSSTSTDHKYIAIAPASQRVVKNNATIGGGGETINGVTYDAANTLNIGALAGVEFFITKELSLSAEYQLGYTMISYPDMQDVTGAVTTTTKRGSANVIGVLSTSSGTVANRGGLTLSVYF